MGCRSRQGEAKGMYCCIGSAIHSMAVHDSDLVDPGGAETGPVASQRIGADNRARDTTPFHQGTRWRRNVPVASFVPLCSGRRRQRAA
jgi:hypothetical protein